MEVLNNTLTEACQSLTDLTGIDVTPVMIITTIVVAFLLLAVLGFSKGKKRRQQKGSNVLLLGCCDAGKTALFLRLRHGQFDATKHSSHTSQTVNQATFKSRPIVDYPGHFRLRGGVEKWIASAGAIVFVVDSNSGDFVNDADYLYHLFTHPLINDMQLPILIACNKSDMITAVEIPEIKKSLESHLNAIRSSQTSQPGQKEAENQVYLGIEGEKFTMDHLTIPVEFASVSVHQGTNSDELENFIQKMGFQQ